METTTASFPWAADRRDPPGSPPWHVARPLAQRLLLGRSMSDLSTSASVGLWAALHPSAIRAFERHHIDFCCRGARPLSLACAEVGVVPEALLAEISALEQAGPTPRRWDDAPLPELIDHILADFHAPLPGELQRLGDLLDKVRRVHGGKSLEAEQRLSAVAQHFRQLREELDVHLAKEERILFPWIRSGRGATAGGPVQVMLLEHDGTADLLRRIRALTHDHVAPEGACATWRALWQGLQALESSLHEHIHLESNVLFPRALADGGR